jgi:ABC-type antimicrobial peptide transport system permease subunit
MSKWEPKVVRAFFDSLKRNAPLPGLAAAPIHAASMTLPIEISPATLAFALLISAAGGTITGWLGARKAAGLKAAQVLRDD